MKIVAPEKSPGGPKSPGGEPAAVRFPERYRTGELSKVTQGEMAKKLNLDEQYRLHQKGDVARQLGLYRRPDEATSKDRSVGWMRTRRPPQDPPAAKPMPEVGKDRDDHRHSHHDDFAERFHYRGPVSPALHRHCFDFVYCGPSYYPYRCWYPHWSPWVDWSWHYHCQPLWDPRPVWCRPVVYVAAPVWGYWPVPVWMPLPVAACGTWVDVPPVIVGHRFDLQLLAVRFVDPGHPEENLGPRYRVWFRNNSERPLKQPFNVVLLASADDQLRADLPQAGVRVTAIEPGGIQAIDLRLPVAASTLGRDREGKAVPFATLHALIDANREIPETAEENNGALLARSEVLPIDPAAFEAQPKTAAPGGEVLLAGEGFGPEPGQVLLHLGGIEMQGEIRGWYDLGVQVALPNLPLTSPTQAELIVVRGDGAAANPLSITLAPGTVIGQLGAPPAIR